MKFFLGGVAVVLLVVIFCQSDIGRTVVASEQDFLNVYRPGKEYYRNGVIPFTSQEKVELVVDYNENTQKEVQIDIYKADEKSLLKFLVYAEKTDKAQGTTGMYQVNPAPKLKAKDRINSFVKSESGTIIADLPNEGIYILHCKAGVKELDVFVIKSGLGVVVKERKKGLLFWVQDINTGKKMTNVPLQIYNLNGNVSKKAESFTNDDGIALTESSRKYDVAIVGEGKAKTVVTINMAELANNYYGYEGKGNSFPGQEDFTKTVIFTDRPLYKPGDTVHFKAIRRWDDDEEYSIRSEKLKIKLIRGWGDEEKIIAQGEYKVDSYGTVSGEFKIPENIKVGTARLAVTNGKNERNSFFWYDTFSSSVYVDIQHYRKPEYTISLNNEKDVYLRDEKVSFEVEGEYFSGQPLIGQNIAYTIYENKNYWESSTLERFKSEDANNRWGYYSFYGGKMVEEGNLILDNEGKANVSFVPRILSAGLSTYNIEISYNAQGGEQVTARKAVLVRNGEVTIYEKNRQWNQQINKKMQLNLVAFNNFSKEEVVNQKIEVSIKHTHWEKEFKNNSKYPSYKKVVKDDNNFDPLTTDKDGQVIFEYKPTASGRYEFNFKVMDNQGRMTTRKIAYYISGEEDYFRYKEAKQKVFLSTVKEEYLPGETAVIKVGVLLDGRRDVLLTKGRNFIQEYRVVNLDEGGVEESFSIGAEDMPGVNFTVDGFIEDKYNADLLKIAVNTDQQKLHVKIHTDKKEYGPGDTVVLDIKVTDNKGNPQKTNITLWAVDKALFELVDRKEMNLFKYFWGENSRRGYISSSHSLEGIAINAAEKGGGGGDIRTAFVDLATWDANIFTNKKGLAKTSFKLPDNLTTFSLFAKGVTKDTKLGDDYSEIKVSKPLVITPYLPNVLYYNDNAQVVTSINNFTNEQRTVVASLEITGGTVSEKQQTLTIDGGANKSVFWNIKPQEKAENITMVFAVQDKSEEALRDSIRQIIPVKAIGYWDVQSNVLLDQDRFDLVAADSIDQDKTELNITITSSLYHSFLDSMEYLVRYPYGCNEQLTSSLAPAIFVKENAQLFEGYKFRYDIDEIIEDGVSKLSDTQNNDGSWAWWRGGAQNLFISSYVTEYLLRAQKTGTIVEKDVLVKAKKYFTKYTSKNKNEEILIAYTKTLFGDFTAVAEIRIDDSLQTDVMARGVITNIRNGHTNKETNGYNLLLKRSTKSGAGMFWPNSGADFFGSKITSTSWALKALLVADEDNDVVNQIVYYLSRQRRNSYWYNTFATAQTLDSIFKFAKKNPVAAVSKRYDSYLNNEKITNTTSNSNNTVQGINIPGDKLLAKEYHFRTETVDNQRPAFLTYTLKQFRLAVGSEGVNNGLKLTRRYVNIKGTGLPIGVGDKVEVILDVEREQRDIDMEYLLVEDKLPAGMVPINNSFKNTTKNRNYNSCEYLIDGVTCYNNYHGWSGKERITYLARVISAGDFTAPPAFATLMYFPEFNSRTPSQEIHINKELTIVTERDESKRSSRVEGLWKSKYNFIAHRTFKNIVILITIILLMSGVIIFSKGSKSFRE